STSHFMLCSFQILLKFLSQVTGYVGHNVTLPCRFIQGKESSNVTQSQWDFLSPDGNKTLIMVFNKQHGKSVLESHLKGRVDMDDQLLQIKNVELSDAGSYICTINNFPLGTLESTTKLHVQGEKNINL
uniref:Ig-like domain-containing protein n=1 Tax=Oryzias sinensis TaxID=183150 RepID=A0A8C8DTV7_9TELE